MENASYVTTILLSAYYGMGELKLVYFCFFLFLYIFIIVENVALIGVIYTEKSLHEPMYFLLGNLAATGLYGSTGLLPALLSNMISPTPEVSVQFCQTQIWMLHTYGVAEFTILAVMSYDRYVAICRPLQYHTIMPLNKVYKLIAFSWLYPIVLFLLLFVFTVQLRFCKNILNKFYCLNYALLRLSCTDTTVHNIAGLLSVFFHTLPQIVMVTYTYAHILKICMTSRESKVKAIRTCSPHMFAMINYTVGCFFELLESRFTGTHRLPYQAKMFMSLYFLMFPAFLNPVIYGLSIKAIRTPLVKLFQSKKRTRARKR